ncbi:MAG: hypothetical protein KIT72_08205 [Polyangiaceae bacterium]|nr:hypothetical protein [Polyangiaceae bacterium]MCW5790389.1 hypothetical protein [Polyangiaceae bacterium]
MRTLAYGAGLACLLSLGCANVLGIEDTEEAPACQSGDYSYNGGDGPGEGPRVGGRGEDYSCVNNLPQPLAESDTVDISLVIVNLINPTEPIGGIKVRACGSRGDVNCTNVVAQAVSGADGSATLTVPTRSNRGLTGYQGYLEFEGPDSQGRVFMPYLQFFTRPVTRDRFFPLLLVRREDFVTLFSDHQDVAGDSSLGALALEAVDCPNAMIDQGAVGAPNVRFAIADSCRHLTASSQEFYFANSVPSTTVKATQSALAIGGFIGVKPANDVVVEAYWRTDAQNLRVVQDRVIVRPGALTTLRFEPNQ